MKKAKLIAASLLASSLLLAGCGKNPGGNNPGDETHECADENKDHLCDVCGATLSEHSDENGDHICDICEAGLPFVNGVTVTGAPESMVFGESATLTVAVDAQNGASSEFTVAASNENVSIVKNSDGTLTVTAAHGGEVTITITASEDETKTASATLEIMDWSDLDLLIMQKYLRGRIPFVEGTWVWTDYYFDDWGCLTADAKDAEVEDVVATLEGYGLESIYDEDYETYVFDIEVSDGSWLEIQVYAGYPSGTTIDVYPFHTAVESWPAEEIASITDFIGEEVPEAEATSYILYTTPGFYLVEIDCEGADLDAYVAALEEAGFEVFFDDDYGCYTAQLNDMLIDVYEGEKEGQIAICVYTTLNWPEMDLAIALTSLLGHEAEIPEFTAEQFLVTDSSAYGMVAINSLNSDSLEDYVAVLEDLGWDVEYDEENDQYTALNPNDYSYILTMYFDDVYNNGIVVAISEYSEPSTEWPTEWVAEQVAEIEAEGTAVPAPTFEGIESYVTLAPAMGYGPVVQVNVDDVESACAAYCAQLEELGYFVVADNYGAPLYALEGETLGISPQLTYDDLFWIELLPLDEPAAKPSPIPVITEWPAEELADILGDKTEETVPAYTGEGLEFVIAASTISPNKANIGITNGDFDTYKLILVNAGYTIVDESTGYGEFLSPGKTIVVYASQDSDTLLSLTIKAQDAPAAGATFPTDAVTAALGGEKSYPIPTGTSFTASNPYGYSDVVIEITGGDKAAYVQALLDAGFAEDPDSSYPGSYVGYVDPTSEFVIYVWEAGTNTDYTIEFGPYYVW